MPSRWFKRDRDRSDEQETDAVDERLRRQAQRSGRTVGEEQELILRDVLPNVRKAVADTGLTMGQYLQLNRVEYQELLTAQPGPSLLGRRGGLVDYDAFLRLRRWIAAAAERAGEDVESWVVCAGTSAPRRPWERGAARSPVAPEGAASAASVTSTPDSDAAPTPPSAAERRADDEVLDHLERLAALRDSGALSDDEFQTQKRRLLQDGS
ncbi:MAG: SHOCT domain-containing protein [Patulibacter sp.]